VPPRPTVNVGARPPVVAAPAVNAGPVWHASEQPEPYRPPAGQAGLPTSLEQPQPAALPPVAPPPVPRAVPMVRPPESANRPAEAAVRAQPVVRPVAPAAAPVVVTPAAPAAAAEPPQKARPAPIPRGPQDGEERRDNRHENRSEKQRGRGPEDTRQAEGRGGERVNWR